MARARQRNRRVLHRSELQLLQPRPRRKEAHPHHRVIAWEDVGVSADLHPELVVDANGAVTRLTNDSAADQNLFVDTRATGHLLCAPQGMNHFLAAAKAACCVAVRVPPGTVNDRLAPQTWPTWGVGPPHPAGNRKSPKKISRAHSRKVRTLQRRRPSPHCSRRRPHSSRN